MSTDAYHDGTVYRGDLSKDRSEAHGITGGPNAR